MPSYQGAGPERKLAETSLSCYDPCILIMPVTNMHGYISRRVEEHLEKALGRSPAVAILGPRQCGKSTLAREYLRSRAVEHVSLDLQDRSDRNKLREPELFLEQHRGHLVCLDEIQLTPNLSPVLRVEIDRERRPGRFLILGSASRDLLRQSTETLAGRIAVLELTTLGLDEVADFAPWQTVWTRGGFPESLLATNDEASFDWRLDFIKTFLERDIPQLGYAIPAGTIERLWKLLSHYHGQILNYSKAAQAANLAVPTLKKYLRILEQTFMIRLLPPMEANLKKRLVKSPKVYLRDSGILHALNGIETYDDLLSHPGNGASWEGWVIETLLSIHRRWKPSFLRTSNQAEVDIILERGTKRVLIECKLTKAPSPSRGFYQLIQDLRPQEAWIVAPVDQVYEVASGVRVGNVHHVRLDHQ